ncbi:hypothetical protein HDU91_002773, partial [Kappamyces sp. JEL0680]
MLKHLEEKIGINQKTREEFADDPLKFIESEADLEQGLYGMFKDLGGHLVVGQLLAHPNSDIAVSAIGVLNELTDEDVVGEGVDEKAQEGIQALATALLSDSILKLVLDVLEKLDESRDDDKEGVFNALSVLGRCRVLTTENCVAINPDLDTPIFSLYAPWMITRISQGKGFDSVRGYVAEILAILLQSSKENRIRLVELGGLDTLLQILSYYRKRDPKDGDEVEMMENVFDVVCGLVQEPFVCPKFVEAEGIELMLIMIKERKMSRMRAFKLLDHALHGTKTEACAQFVNLGGLKSLFTAFMKKGSAKYKKEYSESYSQKEEDEHVVSILYSLFVNLQDADDVIKRLVYKFVEQDFEKLHRLLLLHAEYSARVENAETDDYLDRLDAGQYLVQLVDAIILFCCKASPEIIGDRVPVLLEGL